MQSKKLTFLVVGLGSMGKRRIRNLQHLGYSQIAGFDPRQDRREEAQRSLHVKTFSSLEGAAAEFNPDAIIISVPPDKHHVYMDWAFRNNLHFFVEASVIDTGYEGLIKKAKESSVVAAPSCTLNFHPAIIRITELCNSGALGTISSVLYHSGQYLPDWHTYENVSDYYVSSKETGGAREIVPFELSWLAQTFGFPKAVSAVYKKTIVIEGAPDIDDTYTLIADYDGFILNLTVDVVSRCATRRLLINGSLKQLRWDWDDNFIKVYEPRADEWKLLDYEVLPSKEGYNRNITELMYIEEMANFIEAIHGSRPFRNSLEFDLKVLNVLYAAEKSYRTNKAIEI